MRCLWEISIWSLLRETSQRPLRNVSKKMTLCDVFKTSQIHLKIDVLFVASSRRPKNISENMSFVGRLQDVYRIQYIKKYVFSETSLGRLNWITSLPSTCGFSKILPRPAWMHIRCIFETFHTASQTHLKEGWLGNFWEVSERVTKDASLETTLRSLKISRRHLRVASKNVILGLQTNTLFI